LESRSETLLIEEPWPGERVSGSGDEDDSTYPAHVMLADVAGQQSKLTQADHWIQIAAL
jgi:hypothetical protein